MRIPSSQARQKVLPMNGKRAGSVLTGKEALRTAHEVVAESREAKAFGLEPTALLQRVGARRGRYRLVTLTRPKTY
jgi:hypothetical protein